MEVASSSSVLLSGGHASKDSLQPDSTEDMQTHTDNFSGDCEYSSYQLGRTKLRLVKVNKESLSKRNEKRKQSARYVADKCCTLIVSPFKIKNESSSEDDEFPLVDEDYSAEDEPDSFSDTEIAKESLACEKASSSPKKPAVAGSPVESGPSWLTSCSTEQTSGKKTTDGNIIQECASLNLKRKRTEMTEFQAREKLRKHDKLIRVSCTQKLQACQLEEVDLFADIRPQLDNYSWCMKKRKISRPKQVRVVSSSYMPADTQVQLSPESQKKERLGKTVSFDLTKNTVHYIHSLSEAGCQSSPPPDSSLYLPHPFMASSQQHKVDEHFSVEPLHPFQRPPTHVELAPLLASVCGPRTPPGSPPIDSSPLELSHTLTASSEQDSKEEHFSVELPHRPKQPATHEELTSTLDDVCGPRTPPGSPPMDSSPCYLTDSSMGSSEHEDKVDKLASTEIFGQTLASRPFCPTEIQNTSTNTSDCFSGIQTSAEPRMLDSDCGGSTQIRSLKDEQCAMLSVLKESSPVPKKTPLQISSFHNIGLGTLKENHGRWDCQAYKKDIMPSHPSYRFDGAPRLRRDDVKRRAYRQRAKNEAYSWRAREKKKTHRNRF